MNELLVRIVSVVIGLIIGFIIVPIFVGVFLIGLKIIVGLSLAVLIFNTYKRLFNKGDFRRSYRES